MSWPAYPGSYGTGAAQRLSGSAWQTYRGVCGHMHVPENSHGDPGNIPIGSILEGADMPTAEEIAREVWRYDQDGAKSQAWAYLQSGTAPSVWSYDQNGARKQAWAYQVDTPTAADAAYEVWAYDQNGARDQAWHYQQQAAADTRSSYGRHRSSHGIDLRDVIALLALLAGVVSLVWQATT